MNISDLLNSALSVSLPLSLSTTSLPSGVKPSFIFEPWVPFCPPSPTTADHETAPGSPPSHPRQSTPPYVPVIALPAPSSLQSLPGAVSASQLVNVRPIGCRTMDSGGASSFAGRHPLKEVQPSRLRFGAAQSDAVKAGKAAKKVVKEQKANGLRDGVESIMEVRDSAIKKLAERLSVTEKAVRTAVNGETHYVKHRQPNLFNALVHQETGRMNEDLGLGDRHNLSAIQEFVRDKQRNNGFSEAEQQAALLELSDSRKMKTMGSRANNTAPHANARATTSAIASEFTGLGMRTGITGLALFAKGHVHDNFSNTILEYEGSSSFFLDVFNMQPEDVCSKFQQWVCNRKIVADGPANLQNMQNTCVALISTGLHLITGVRNLSMNYVNYRTSIMQKHHVQLLGWPTNIPFLNPHQITTVAAAKNLRQALLATACKWVTMTKRQQIEHDASLEKDVGAGKVVGKKRKARSDKGRKRKRAASDDEGKEEDQRNERHDDEDNDPPPSKKKMASSKASTSKRTKRPLSTTSARTTATKTNNAEAVKKAWRIACTLPPAAPKSKECINTSDESDS